TEASAAQAEAVLAHEMAHVRGFDWPMLMLAQIAAALLWFNPLVWWLGRALASEIELAADEQAIGQVARLDYAQTLLAVGAGSAHRAACGMTYARHTLGQRIRELLEATPRRSASRLRCATMLVAAVALAGPLAVLRLVPVAAQAAPVAEQERYFPAVFGEMQILPRASQDASRLVSSRKRKLRRASANAVFVRQPEPVAVLPEPVAPAAPAPLKRGLRWEQTRAMTVATRHATIEARQVARDAERAERARLSQRDRGKALGMSEAANGMRAKARTLEMLASDPSVPREIRNEHIRTASNLRRLAQTNDEEARRLIRP
ncbi:MAG: M56 family metallopeptidase, partial [Sphingomonadales bacterium]